MNGLVLRSVLTKESVCGRVMACDVYDGGSVGWSITEGYSC